MTITLSPNPVETLAHDLVSKCRLGQFEEAKHAHYAPTIVSIEATEMPGFPSEIHGLDAVIAKGQHWAANTEVHQMAVSDPLVAGAQFAVKFTMDVTCKMTNQRNVMEEIGLYHVENGKIVREQFFYNQCQG